MGRLNRVEFPRPSREDQASIVEFLAQTNASFSLAIARARREIALLGEYRTRLIADAVTGKLDVREAASRLPSEATEAPVGDEDFSFDLEAVDVEGRDVDAGDVEAAT
jgi:type I restriction enzyme S subunit